MKRPNIIIFIFIWFPLLFSIAPLIQESTAIRDGLKLFSKSTRESKGGSSIHRGEFDKEKCPCHQTQLDQFTETIEVDGKGTEYSYVPEPIGDGGTSKVYHGISPDGDRCVAIKVIDLAGINERFSEKDRAALVEEYVNEERIFKIIKEKRSMETGKKIKFTDSRIIERINFVKTEEKIIFVLEKGDQSLAQYWDSTVKTHEKRGWMVMEAKKLVKEMAEALEEFHSYDLIHLDIKPENFVFVINSKTGKPMLKLIDFANSLELDPEKVQEAEIELNSPKSRSLSGSGKKMQKPKVNRHGNVPAKVVKDRGTILFMSPEQLRQGKLTQKSDIWSFAVTVYYLLATAGGNMSQGPYPFLVDTGRSGVPVDELKREMRETQQSQNFNFIMPTSKWHIQPTYKESNMGEDSEKPVVKRKKIIDIYKKMELLLEHSLKEEPIQRPVAEGTVKYLNKKCKVPRMLEHVSNL